MFTGQRVRRVFDEHKKKKYISIDQKLSVQELEEISIPKHLKDTDLCDKQLHTSYRSLLGSINWLQSRAQFQACYSFSRLASASAAPTIGHCKELNKLCRQIRNDEVEMRVWPVIPRIIGIPDAAFRNNSDKSSQRAMTIFIADERVKGRRDTRGSLMFFESTKIKRTTLSTTVAELYAHEVFWYMSDASRTVEGHQWTGCRHPHSHRCQQPGDNSFNNTCSRTAGNNPHDSNVEDGSLFRSHC